MNLDISLTLPVMGCFCFVKMFQISGPLKLVNLCSENRAKVLVDYRIENWYSSVKWYNLRDRRRQDKHLVAGFQENGDGTPSLRFTVLSSLMVMLVRKT